MSEEEKRAWRLKNFGTEKCESTSQQLLKFVRFTTDLSLDFDDLDDIMEGYPDLDYEMNAMKKD